MNNQRLNPDEQKKLRKFGYILLGLWIIGMVLLTLSDYFDTSNNHQNPSNLSIWLLIASGVFIVPLFVLMMAMLVKRLGREKVVQYQSQKIGFNHPISAVFLSLIIATVIYGIIRVFVTMNSTMTIIVIGSIFAVVWLILYKVQRTRLAQQGESFNQRNHSIEWANPQVEPQGKKLSPIVRVVIIVTALVMMFISIWMFFKYL